MNKKNKKTMGRRQLICMVIAAFLPASFIVPVWAEDMQMVESVNNGTETPDEKNIEITSYMETYKELVEKLGMSSTDSWQFLGNDSYVVDQFYLEWEGNNWSMKNEGAPYIKLYGFSLGDSVETVEKTLLEKEWVAYYNDDKENMYLAIINDKPYMISLRKDENNNLTLWYFCNWPEGDDVGEFLSKSREKQANKSQTSQEMYEYTNGEFLSDFSISETDGKKRADLMFWHNYGDSASDEDFFFDWEDGQWDYELTGNRSAKKFMLNFTPTDAGYHIKVTCMEGNYFSWQTGQQNTAEWVNEEYAMK